MPIRAHIGSILLAITVALGLAFGFFPRAIPVDLVTVIKGPFMVTVEEEGKTRVMERFVVSAPMTGYVRRIDLHVGDPVTTGQVLAVLEPARADALDPRTRAQSVAQVQAAEAAVAAARENVRAAAAQSEFAQQDLERNEALSASRFVSRQALDRARTEVNRTSAVKSAADHAVNVALYELDMARATLTKSTQLQAGGPAETIEVKAPVDASILKVVHESEGTVHAGQALIEIGNPELLEVEVEVLSTQAIKIVPGSSVLFERWGGDATLLGVVRVVEPAGFTKISALGVEEQRVRVIVDFTSPREHWERLGDGYRVEARFVIWEGADILQIPASALFRHNSGWAVFAVESGRARITTVQIGQRAGLITEVTSGLTVGAQVISHPSDRIKDGVRVTARKGISE